MAEIEKELKSPLIRMKEEREKRWLKTQHSKTLRSWHLVPITSWQIQVEKVEAVTDFLFLGSKITVVVTVAMELKDAFACGRKTMVNLKSIFKNRGI